MCNSSFQGDNFTSTFDETLQWYFICQGHFGTLVISYSTALFLFAGRPTLLVPLVVCAWKHQSQIGVTAEFYYTGAVLLFLLHCGKLPDGYLSLWSLLDCQTFSDLAMIHPVTFLRYKAIQYRIVLTVASWLIAVGNSVRLVLIRISVFPDDTVFSVFSLGVMSILFYCSSVLYALKRPGPGDRNNVEVTVKDRHNKTNRGRAVENQQKRKAFGIISHILVSVLVCYLPLVVAYFMHLAHMCELVFAYNAFPLILSITRITVLILPLVRMYNEGHLKRVMSLSKIS